MPESRSQGNGDAGAKSLAHETEQSVLGGLLLDSSRYTEVAKVVQADDFADLLHAAVFEAIGRLVKAGRPVDALTVAAQLEADGHDEYAGAESRSYLAALAANTPSAANIVRYAELVRDRARAERRKWRAERAQGEPSALRTERDGRLFDPHGTPVVRWIEGKLPAVVDQAEAALIDAFGMNGCDVYQRDRMLVRVLRRPEPSIRNYKRAPGVLGIQTVTPPFLTELFTRCAIWERYDGRTGGWKRINAPKDVASTYMERAGHWRVPPLWDTISAPTLRPDGTILQNPGYDHAMHVYYDPCGVTFPEIPENPDVDAAQEAFSLLCEAFGTFPFESEVDRSVALAGVLTSVVRRSLPSAPLIAISAPMANSGKTLLADAIGIVGMGSKPPVMTLAKTDEEAQKTSLAVLVESDPVVLIDNVSRPLEGDWLCSILTSETFRQRVLGRTEMMTVPTRILWIATGNHFRVIGDMRSRTLLCRIDAKMENPGERKFKGDFRKELLARRPELVAAALTLMRAFITTKERPESHVAPWGRFEAWSDMVRAPLVWMEAADPCQSIRSLEAMDPVRADHLRLVSFWWECFGDKPMTARDVLDWLKSNSTTNTWGDRLYGLWTEIAAGKDGQVSSRSMGRYLEARAGSPVGGYTIELHTVRDHVNVWRVVREEEAKA